MNIDYKPEPIYKIPKITKDEFNNLIKEKNKEFIEENKNVLKSRKDKKDYIDNYNKNKLNYDNKIKQDKEIIFTDRNNDKTLNETEIIERCNDFNNDTDILNTELISKFNNIKKKYNLNRIDHMTIQRYLIFSIIGLDYKSSTEIMKDYNSILNIIDVNNCKIKYDNMELFNIKEMSINTSVFYSDNIEYIDFLKDKICKLKDKYLYIYNYLNDKIKFNYELEKFKNEITANLTFTEYNFDKLLNYIDAYTTNYRTVGVIKTTEFLPCNLYLELYRNSNLELLKYDMLVQNYKHYLLI